MFTASSQTVTEEYKASVVPNNEWKFQINNGNVGELLISDPLLDSEPLARERAMSEFLKNSYKLKEVSFRTPMTNINKNDVIGVMGLSYLVKSISTTITKTSITSIIKAVRYE